MFTCWLICVLLIYYLSRLFHGYNQLLNFQAEYVYFQEDDRTNIETDTKNIIGDSEDSDFSNTGQFIQTTGKQG